ncbi:Intercellular signal essential for a variety of patterning events during development (By similarity) [Seminavis robusta]|uniref:Intercellular signal essential for a variety of patterning events during development By similarity n=1 Tax=Seminavis robusta TaxID=568900 RepID=A0A9N8DQC1_9STRA|nr:Intercellular signal essential for a variety of patterning events during development (By similarity) [Seminavis robusta]|eukprot:Sro183_g079550.1 Intercellular signal essential for a variety of patterning events during development (By similarity) (434) ;mRNA; r:8216-9517
MTTPAPSVSPSVTPSVSPTFAGSCSFSVNFGSGAVLSTHGMYQFNQAAGTSATCTLTCDSGATTNLWLAYDETPSIFNHDAAAVDITGCSSTVSIAASVDECFLGYRVESAYYNNMVLTCTCNSLGPSSCPTPAPQVAPDCSQGSKSKEKCSGDGGDVCFSKDTTVKTQSRGTVQMKDLQEGELILTGTTPSHQDIYEPVFRFGHKNQDKSATFLKFYTNMLVHQEQQEEETETEAAPLEISPSHLIFKLLANGQQLAVRADSLQVGDTLVQGVGGQHATILQIKEVTKRGLYMPLTPTGNIVVNGGYKASTYVSNTDWAPTFVRTLHETFGIPEQTLFHWFLAPFRSVCLGLSLYCGDVNEQGILNYLLWGQQLAMWVEATGVFCQTWIVAPLFIVFFGMWNVFDRVFGVTLLAVPLLVLLRRWKQQHVKQD